MDLRASGDMAHLSVPYHQRHKLPASGTSGFSSGTSACVGYRCPSKGCIPHPSTSAKPRQGMGCVRLSLVVRHGPATAPGMSTGPCGPIAASLDIDKAPLFCFGRSLGFSGCCIWETFPAKWLIPHLFPVGLQRKCGSFLCNLCLPGNTSTGSCFKISLSIVATRKSQQHLHRALTALGLPGPFKDFYFPIFLCTCKSSEALYNFFSAA